jgi:thiosulfate dehydrogenase [quinone] large subunit
MLATYNIMDKKKVLWAILRVCLGFVFLWPFLDKTFGLGFSTLAEKSWLAGNSPTLGFLTHATKGPLALFYQSLAGMAWVDWTFMIGLLLIGLTLILGVMIRISTLSGSIMLFLMWTASFPPANNPLLDDHIIYILVLIGINMMQAGKFYGLGNWWHNLKIVKRYNWLE